MYIRLGLINIPRLFLKSMGEPKISRKIFFLFQNLNLIKIKINVRSKNSNFMKINSLCFARFFVLQLPVRIYLRVNVRIARVKIKENLLDIAYMGGWWFGWLNNSCMYAIITSANAITHHSYMSIDREKDRRERKSTKRTKRTRYVTILTIHRRAVLQITTASVMRKAKNGKALPKSRDV